MLVVRGGPLSLTASVFNTLGLNDCPVDSWRALDAEALAREYDARKVILNGPRHCQELKTGNDGVVEYTGAHFEGLK